VTRRPRCLVIHPGALGDVLLALPALAHLGTLEEGLMRVLATAPRFAGLLEGSGYVEETVDFDRLGLHRLFVAEPDHALIEDLAGYDAIVSWFGAADPTYRGHLLSLETRLHRPLVIGRATPSPSTPRHASRHLLETLAPWGPVPAHLPPVRLRVEHTDRAWAAAWLAARGLARDRVVVLHPGAGHPAKAWPGYGVLARRLQTAGVPAVLVTGPADTAVAARLVGGGGVPEVRVARDWPLTRLAALCEVARGFVGNDSGLSHLAAAVGCPTLVLFGPTDPRRWAPGGPPGECPHVVALAGAGVEAADPWAGVDVERVGDTLLELIAAAPAAMR
jgi:ADP-heptose:LPS heptosyltransferase